MPTHVLVADDGSDKSERAVEFVADEWGDASITLLHVIDPVQAGYGTGALPSGSEAWYQRAKETADGLLAESRERFLAARDGDGSAPEIDTRTEVGRPAATIVEVAGEIDADHVVVGSHGRKGVSRLILGSVAESVVRRSPVPVTVVR